MTTSEAIDIRARVNAADLERGRLLLAAATMPARREPDPPTGPIAAASQPSDEPYTPLRGPAPQPDGDATKGGGIQWRFAPVLWSGNVSLDGRWSRDGDGSRTRQLLFNTNLDGVTYLWQPWFVQVRGGVGALVGRGSSTDLFGASRSDDLVAWTGRLGVNVFPASRFPFEARGDVSDSRAGGDFLGTDYRSKRFSVSQSYRPPTGGDSYNVTYDYSALSSSRQPDDIVRSLRGLMVNTSGNHTFELSGIRSVNERGASNDESRLVSVTGRHGYRGGASLTVDNLATYNDVNLRSEASALDFTSNVRQLSSFASWRPQRGDALYSTDHALYVTGSVRLVDTETESGGVMAQSRSSTGLLGASLDLDRHWRLSASGAASRVTQTPGEDMTLGNEAVTLGYTPESILLGAWRYTPQVSASGNFTQGGPEGARSVLGGQFGHGVARGVDFGPGNQGSFTLAQNLGVTRDSTLDELTRTVGHSASLFWRLSEDGLAQAQTFAGLSLSDSRSYGAAQGTFQLANAQLTRRAQLSRTSSWSGSVTAQASRSRFATPADPAAPPLPAAETDTGWRYFYSGSLSYTDVRAFGIPRLRFSLLGTANSERGDRRAQGDPDAMPQRVSHSLEARFDHMIGRLDSRLTLRTAKVDGRRQDVIFFRINRSFGGY